jgi:hypothetical protein
MHTYIHIYIHTYIHYIHGKNDGSTKEIIYVWYGCFSALYGKLSAINHISAYLLEGEEL